MMPDPRSGAPRTGPGQQAIAISGLSRHFDDTAAVDGLDLGVDRGEIYGFLGPNGAGKSTTVRILCTLLAPTSGRATVAGYDVVAQPNQVRARIGAALQDVALDPKQTGTELLRLQGRLYGLNGSEIGARLVELGALVDLGDALDRPIDTYSGGMKRRLDLAAALVHNPDVLFLDEPTTGLDPISRARVWEEVRRLNEQLGMTIFLTTQYLEEADALAHRVGIIDEGALVAEGTPDELKRTVGEDVIIVRIAGDPAVASDAIRRLRGIGSVESRRDEVVVSVEDGAAAVGPVAVALADTDVVLRDITLRTPTLDDVFLQLTGNRIGTEATRPDDAARTTALAAPEPADLPSPYTPEPAEALR
jgi:ABC-2 type transport system ATP-binding protein